MDGRLRGASEARHRGGGLRGGILGVESFGVEGLREGRTGQGEWTEDLQRGRPPGRPPRHVLRHTPRPVRLSGVPPRVRPPTPVRVVPVQPRVEVNRHQPAVVLPPVTRPHARQVPGQDPHVRVVMAGEPAPEVAG